MRLGSGAIWSGAVTFRTEIVSISNKFTVEDMIFSCCSLILIQYIPPLKAAFLSLQRTAFWILERGKGIQSPSQAFPLPNSWTCLSRVRAKVVLQRCSDHNRHVHKPLYCPEALIFHCEINASYVPWALKRSGAQLLINNYKKEKEERKDHKSQLPPKTSLATKPTTSFLLSLLINTINTKHPGLPTAHWCQVD